MNIIETTIARNEISRLCSLFALDPKSFASMKKERMSAVKSHLAFFYFTLVNIIDKKLLYA